MPFDGMIIYAVAGELNSIIKTGRIDKIFQPEKDELQIAIRSKRENFRLLISAGANNSRIHLTKHPKPNPSQAPMFCMYLRKLLAGGRIVSVEQYKSERIMDINIESMDELGVLKPYKLRVEIMGRHSNIILLDSDDKILDCIKHIDENKSRIREVLPGLIYEMPPSQNKVDAKQLSVEEISKILDAEDSETIERHIAAKFMGISRPTAREIAVSVIESAEVPVSKLDNKACNSLAVEIAARYKRIENLQLDPYLINDLKKPVPKDFYLFKSSIYPSEAQESRELLSYAADDYYYLRDLWDRISQRTSNMKQVVNRNINRCNRKLSAQNITFLNVENMDKLRLYGDLITGNLHLIKKGMQQVQVTNWYDEDGGDIIIPLSPVLSPNGNAQKYYKRYRKLKIAKTMIEQQIADTKEELNYLEGQLHILNTCDTEAEVQEIRDELSAQGYLRDKKLKGRKKLNSSKPLAFVSSDGFDIYVGRNNKQNDQLTMSFAKSRDIWMHTKDIPGSHVIIREKDGKVSETALNEGAMLAAYYSKAKNSSMVPVDYTQKKNVKKPNGSKPGFVIYLTNKTAYVTPIEDVVKGLAIKD